MSLDTGHYNCRDYNVSLDREESTVDGVEVRALGLRQESWDDLERRSRSPAGIQSTFPLLKLPLELRQQIYSHLIPTTRELRQSDPLGRHARNFPAVQRRQAQGMLVSATRETTRQRPDSAAGSIIWHRGCTSLLAVCRQLHDEAAEMMYGSSTFLLFVTYLGITFGFRWMLPSGLAPRRSLPFLDMMPKKYLALIRRVVIHVDHVDGYTGMTKFNVSGKGLIHGLRNQVQKLVAALQPDTDVQLQHEDASSARRDKTLTKVKVRVSNSNAVLDTIKHLCQLTDVSASDDINDVREILEPFEDLSGVRDVSFTGAITDELAGEFERKMRSRKPRKLHACCCPNIK